LVEQPQPTFACREQVESLRRAIEQRRKLLLQVAAAMLRQQGDFLRGHVDAPASIPLGRLADEIGLHPSSVGRVLADKRIDTR
jgi:RNA polymerase sigma-54 factor